MMQLRICKVGLLVLGGLLVSGCGDYCPPHLMQDRIWPGQYKLNREALWPQDATTVTQYAMFSTAVTDLIVSVDKEANTLTFAYTVSGEAQSAVWTYKD